jgi:hypothetical protein
LTEKQKQILLAQYRLKQAEESLDEASFLFTGRKSPRSIINRVYYAMFYAVLALLIFEKFASSKHSGILSFFNRRFIKTGVFPEEIGQSINNAFELRQRGDYREYIELTYGQVEPFMGKARIFVQTIQGYLNHAVFLNES